MPNFICVTCGVQFAATDAPPQDCPICQDERQYVNWNGQQWTTLEALQNGRHNAVKSVESGLTGIGTDPRFAIGQRALLIQSAHGNILWDCISLIDAATIAAINELGGVTAMAISHPHFYSSMVEWSRAFDVPVYLHVDNRPYVMRPDAAIEFWEGETRVLNPEVTLIRCGGHFPGSTVLHWTGADGQGVLLTGDTIQVVQDRRYVSFMYSYPNLIPLPAAKVRRIVAAVEPYPFDRLYGGWWDLRIATDAKAAVSHSADRYCRIIEGE
ncbi:MAG: MBL fold metallo-hydrolase [Anaerolineae bacterium]|nr:MBL fold metallo-hydrolase [Anaerolineae bacterium]MCB0224563.1 MBL fold metallo-hydrolase [Anaerolineae bacterium]